MGLAHRLAKAQHHQANLQAWSVPSHLPSDTLGAHKRRLLLFFFFNTRQKVLLCPVLTREKPANPLFH